MKMHWGRGSQWGQHDPLRVFWKSVEITLLAQWSGDATGNEKVGPRVSHLLQGSG